MKTAALLSVISLMLGLTGCGPERAHAPPLKEIGAKPALPPPQPESPPPQPVTPAVTAVAPVAPPAAGSEYGFLDPLVKKAAESLASQQAVAVVLPAFHFNALFQRFEVSQLGEDLADEIHRRLKEAAGDRGGALSPEQFKIQLKSTNRSLADLESPAAALQLAARLGARYLLRGAIRDAPDAVTIQYEGIDVSDASAWIPPAQKTFRLGEPFGEATFRRFKSASGQVALASGFRIGALADPEKPALQRELQWIISLAVDGLIVEGGANLKEGQLAVLPTQVPSQISFQKQMLALRRAVAAEKERLAKAGFDEAKALEQGPVRILGRTYGRLRDAENAVRELEAENTLSETGELRSTLSRIIFDRAEALGEKAGVEVIPHDQLVNEVMAFSREELEKIKDGVLDEKTKEYFQTKGAKTLLFNELIESGDSFEFVFQIRRLDNLKKVAGPLRGYLEPRFAEELRQFMKK
ncbi:MAG: hypothetical protein HY717_21330 [Planctomycetes bacterium]|nr:hypothetical protein [Planctomycetota bacterium]